MHYYDIAVQEAEQKQEVERQLDLQRRLAEASSGELKKKLDELKKQIQEKDAQVYISHSIQIIVLMLMMHVHYTSISDWNTKKEKGMYVGKVYTEIPPISC